MGAAGDRLGAGVIELQDTPGREGEFQQKVEIATQPLEVKGGVRQWRVTVTTALGARGQDYHISDELVDEKGGLLLIIEYVPDSEREWIQFLGRTARHDHPGQYAVILNLDEYREALGSDAPKESKESGLMEKKILDHINMITAKKLGEVETQLERGTLMHKYTAAFWLWYSWQENYKPVGDKYNDQFKLDEFFSWADLCDEFQD